MLNNVWLKIAYDKDSLLKNKDLATYSFENAHWVKVTVEELRSKEFGDKIPPQLQLTSQIIVDRKYKFDPQRRAGLSVAADVRSATNYKNNGAVSANGRFSTGGLSGGAVQLTWVSNPGDEEYDVEWTTLDWGSGYDNLLTSLTTAQTLPDAQLHALFRNNATRITTQANGYNVTLAHYNSYLFFRMRAVHYAPGDGLRIEGAWDYKQADPTGSPNDVYALFDVSSYWHQENLNWQLAATYAEEGKKKEVITYFDGSLRSRQTVTHDNDYENIIVQETVYDKFGRAGAAVLPAPIKAATFGYYPQQSLNAAGAVYSYKDLDRPYDACTALPQGLSTQSGASRYYSGQNDFLGNEAFNQYIPDAQTYPVAVTKYTADNTGRIRMQGGVGPVFQPGNGLHATKFFYGKPYPEELDALFGSDAGYAEHYLKNMVVDANGQISISYVDASGKTVATALTGGSPESLVELPSKPAAQTTTVRLIQPQQFQKDFTNLTLKATTTYLASVAGPADLKFNLERLIYIYSQSNWQICNNCYYDLSIKIADDCGNVIAVPNVPGIVGAAVSNCSLTGMDSRMYNVSFPKVGEYQICFELAMSKKVMEDYLNEYIATRQARNDWKSEFQFVKDYLLQENFLNCFSDCRTCGKELGTQQQFIDNAKKQLNDRGIAYSTLEEPELASFLTTLYGTLSSQCAAQKASCVGSPCDRYKKLMLTDVSPGGQYALFAADGTPLETNLNVILNHWRNDAFPALPASDPLYQGSLITLEDGTVTSPYDGRFTLVMLLQYWKDEWAEKFLPFHPEYCKLQFCYSNTVYFAWDRSVTDDVSTAAQIPTHPSTSGNSYQRNQPSWLVDSDPFFTNASSPGYGLQTAVRADFTNYASRVLRLSQGAEKSLTEFVDYQLYCADIDGNTNTGSTVNNWNNCVPNGNCRMADREWELYKDLYFEVKEKYYDIARKATTCAGACGVGEDLSLPADCPSKNDFALLEGSGICPAGQTPIRFVSNKGPVGRTVILTLAYSQGVNTTGLPATVGLPKGASQTESCLNSDVPLSSVYITGVSCSGDTTAIDNCPFGNGTTLYLPGGSVQVHSYQFEYTDPGAAYSLTYTFVSGTADNPPTDNDYCPDGVVFTKGFFNCCLVYVQEDLSPLQYANVWVVGCRRAGSSNRTLPDSARMHPVPAPLTNRQALPSPNLKKAVRAQANGKASMNGKQNSPSRTLPQLPRPCKPTPYFTGTLTGMPCSIAQRNDGVLYTITTANGDPMPNGSFADITVMINYGSGPAPYKSVFLGSGGTSFSLCISNETLSGATAVYLCSDYVPAASTPLDCPPQLKDKTPRFTSFDYNVPLVNVNGQIAEGLQQIAQQIQSSCETAVDRLMAKLEACLQGFPVSASQKAVLRQKLLEVCVKGGDLEHPYGASTTRPGEASVSGYSSFAQVIRQELGISLSDLCNPWLIESPYPWAAPPQLAEITLPKSNAALCQKIAALQSDYVAANTGGSFHQYLKDRFGAANVNISETELNQLLNSCANCRFLLPKEIKQPVFLDPQTKGCITKTDWDAALAAFSGEFAPGGMGLTSPNYGDVLSTYLNHQWGFTLTFDQYEDYRKELLSRPDAVLCNQPQRFPKNKSLVFLGL